jgi:small-conductance mechanosensitive channel
MLKLLREVAGGQPRVLRYPEPLALFLGFGASSLDFELRVWVADFGEGAAARSDLAIALSGALTAAGIEVPFPQTDLHIRSVAEGILPKPT